MTARAIMARMRRVPEKSIQAAGIELIERLGGVVYVLGVRRRRGDHPGTMQTPGLPDVWFVLPARPADADDPLRRLCCAGWWEVKAARGRLRLEQGRFRDECRAAGVLHLAGGLDVLIECLKAGGWVKG